MKRLMIAATTIAALSTPAFAATPQHKPRLTMAEARVIALKRAPGTIADAEYEREKGAWRYSFDIRQGKRIHEIGVDGDTGRIVEDSYENPKSSD